MSQHHTALSTWLSWALRHDPSEAGIVLDNQGWAGIDQVIAAAASQGQVMSRTELLDIVASSDKQRFALSADQQRIRANQGHSIPVDLGLLPQAPPSELFHGTAERFLSSILAEGLRRQSRQHVHLSPDRDTAIRVGSRHGNPVVLRVAAAQMHAAGHPFYRSENGVWLVESVPADYLVISPEPATGP